MQMVFSVDLRKYLLVDFLTKKVYFKGSAEKDVE